MTTTANTAADFDPSTDRIAWPPPGAAPAPALEPTSGPAQTPDVVPPVGSGRRPWYLRLARGREADPGWVRPALLALLAGTALLYLWNLGASGNANDFYATAVQSMTQDWKAFFFASFDPSNFITVDKPPAALWVMALSGRIFGFNAWSMLVPQALMGVAAVGVLYATVRRAAGPVAGLLAGTVLALTPVAVLMFRFNNPDALLTLLLVVGAYCVVRALEKASPYWVALAGVAIGFGFLTKMLQAVLVLPAFGLVYLFAAPTSVRRRLWHLLLGAGAIVVSAGWWVAAAELWPASSRPYIGGSRTNSVLELAFGYNGLNRLTGGSGGGPVGGGGPGGGNGGFGGAAGVYRLFNDAIGGQVSWLIPAALIALAGGLLVTWRRPRTDLARASLLLWGGWLIVTMAVFSKMDGIFHPYYTIALAPAIGALVGQGSVELWRRRSGFLPRALLAAMVLVTGWWSAQLLHRTPDWHPALAPLLLAASVVAAVGILVAPWLVAWSRTAKASAAVAGVALLALLGGSAAYAVETASVAHGGSIPSAGPSGSGGGFGGFGGMRNGGPGGQGGSTNDALVTLLKQGAEGYRWVAATTGSQSAGPLMLASGTAVMAMGGFSGGDPAPTLAQFQQYVADGKIHYFIAGGGFGSFRGGTGGALQGNGGAGTSNRFPGFPGGTGGFPGGTGQGAQGFTGGGPRGGFGGRGDSSQISSWVAEHYTAVTVGGTTVYDLTKPLTESQSSTG